jgi:DNA repair photolyase
MTVKEIARRCGITRTPGFEEKLLAQFAVNTGLKCGHGCMYCSSSAMLRIQIRGLGLDPNEQNLCIVDPTTPERVVRDARRKRHRGLVQLYTLTDAWAPEAQKYDLGRQCLEALLAEPGWTVRILTKNVAVLNDFDVIEKHRDRVMVGTSITARPDKSGILSIIEPNASLIEHRIEALREARRRGLRAYAMFCPILPGIADSPAQIEQLVKLAVECRAEEIFVEPVDGRGRGLKLTQQALRLNGFHYEAACAESIRCKENWSWYVCQLVKNVQKIIRRLHDLRRLRFLLYPSALERQDLARIKQDDAGVIWL